MPALILVAKLGANPADLPVQQLTKVQLIVNLKAAQSIGLTLPQRYSRLPTKLSGDAPGIHRSAWRRR
jgi:ABC-type uncharacterized transport system substrate-binding protein